MPALKFDPRFVDEAMKLCKLGATDENLGDFFGVHADTIGDWRRKYPEFDQAVARGKVIADMEVANSLFHRATGYSHPAIEFVRIRKKIPRTEGADERGKWPDGKSFDEEYEIREVPYTKHYPPDTLAAIYWLNNRQKLAWAQKWNKEGDTYIDARKQQTIIDATSLAPEERDNLRLLLGKAVAGTGPGDPPRSR